MSVPDLSHAEALTRMGEAEDTLRAIGAGEVDAFVVSHGEPGDRVFMLSTADRPYRRFVENMQDGAATLSPAGVVLYANRRLLDLLAREREEVVGRLLDTFVTGGLPRALAQRLTHRASIVEIELCDRSGAAIPVLVGSSPLDQDGERLICLTFTDLSVQKIQQREIVRLGRAQSERLVELQSAQAALTQQATHDALTGLPNRAVLVDRIERALASASRSGRSAAVLFVDLDRFKYVNDTQGHAAGDALLRRVAGALTAALRPMDTVARVGGDEFVVLAPEVDDREHAAEIGRRLVGVLAQGSEDEPIATSIGVSVSTAGRGRAEELLDEADAAMYHAKALGGGRAEVFDAALGRQVKARTGAELRLRSALDDDRIVVHYQPIVELGTQRTVGHEALARIRSRNGKLLQPCSFIAAAEESGLIVPLGERVLDLACREADAWGSRDRSHGRLNVAVNLSPRQLESGALPQIVHERLTRSGLDPRCLHLELTETAIMDLSPAIVGQLERLRDLGVEVGLDDFGTGYASLTHLRRLPLTFVKIDRSFVSGLGHDREDDRIVGAVVDLAANLGLRSIAEGVETPAQLQRLRAIGCDQGQGFLFAEPMPASKVTGRESPGRPCASAS